MGKTGDRLYFKSQDSEGGPKVPSQDTPSGIPSSLPQSVIDDGTFKLNMNPMEGIPGEQRHPTTKPRNIDLNAEACEGTARHVLAE